MKWLVFDLFRTEPAAISGKTTLEGE